MKQYKRKLAALLACSLLWSNSAQALSDLEGHWAKDVILSLQNQGFVSGYQNNVFFPDKEITRAEFIAALNKMMGFKEKVNIAFSDVKPEDWYWNEVAIAMSAGYVKGYEDGTFRPEQKISRLEAAVFLARANKLPLSKAEEKKTLNLKDLQDLPKWAEAEVEAVLAAGIMKGYENGTFQAERKISRAEAVVSMDRARIAYESVKQEAVMKVQVDKPKKQETQTTIEKEKEERKPQRPSAPSVPSVPSTPSAPSKPELPAPFVPNNPPAVENPAPKDPETPPTVPNLPKGEEKKPEESSPKENNPKENNPKENNPKENDPKENDPKENNPKENNPAPSVPSDPPVKPDPSVPDPSAPEKPAPPKPKKPKPKPQSNPAAIDLQEIVNRGVNQNLATYEKDGQTRRILWVKGINPPKMGENGDFREEKTGDFIDYKADYVAGNHWFDVNKTIDGGNAEIDRNLCYGAVASNMLYWWMEQNAEYISRFIEKQTEKGKFPQNLAPLRDLRKFPNSFESQQKSLLFDYYSLYFGRRDTGFYADLLIDLFVNGFTPSNTGAVNNDRELKTPDARGGFFYEVFGSEILTDRRYSPDYNNFGKVIANILANGEIIGLEHKTAARHASHIITLWGAEYDEQGVITGIYISDSDDQNEGRNVGMKRYSVRNIGGKPKISTNEANQNVGSELYYLHVLSLKQDRWDEYFLKQAASESVSLSEPQVNSKPESIEERGSLNPETEEASKSQETTEKVEDIDKSEVSEEAMEETINVENMATESMEVEEKTTETE